MGRAWVAGLALLTGACSPGQACIMAIIDGDTALVCAWDMAHFMEVKVTGGRADLTLHAPGGPIRLREGVRTVSQGGRTTTLTRTPMMYDGDLFVPARFLTEVIGCTFEYTAKTRAIVAQTKKGRFALGVETLSEIEVGGAKTLEELVAALERAVARSDWRGCDEAFRPTTMMPADGVSYANPNQRRAMEAFRNWRGPGAFRFPPLTRVSHARLNAVKTALGGRNLGLKVRDFYGGDRTNGFWIFRHERFEWRLVGLVTL